jgi:hypothetical protein
MLEQIEQIELIHVEAGGGADRKCGHCGLL